MHTKSDTMSDTMSDTEQAHSSFCESQTFETGRETGLRRRGYQRTGIVHVEYMGYFYPGARMHCRKILFSFQVMKCNCSDIFFKMTVICVRCNSATIHFFLLSREIIYTNVIYYAIPVIFFCFVFVFFSLLHGIERAGD